METTLKSLPESEDASQPSRCASDLLPDRYAGIRRLTEWLCEPLAIEDYVIQSMEDASPTRWHLAHSTWFFEHFVLRAAEENFRPYDASFEYLFNSYYNAVGEQFPRARRGMLSRPTVEEVFEYRAHVDRHIEELLLQNRLDTRLCEILELGFHHEQQHQELILTDLKHLFACNPLFPRYRPRRGRASRPVDPMRWASFPEALREIGTDSKEFAYDHERPGHLVFVNSFKLASRLVTNGEFLLFVESGAYHQPEHWLSDGWKTARDQEWRHPLYWVGRDGKWHEFTLSGLQPLDLDQPVCHVSYYEADAYARWFGARLPTEAEWEVAAESAPVEGNFIESENFHPIAAGGPSKNSALQQLFGDVWEWTSSPYGPYPGYQPPPGALSEYNAKFMCNQFVLRGGSCATPRSHMRATYRNFFPPSARWQVSGLRLAR